jgi:hypothetical protein
MRNFLLLFTIFVLAFPINCKDLSKGYKDILLGMSKTQVEDILKKDPDFKASKQEILTVRIEPDKEIISSEGNGYIKNGYFHFLNDKLFQIFLVLDEKKIGYYLLLKNNTDKFGKPQKLDPKSATWLDNEVSIVIEKSCTIKYFYLPIWNDLIKKDQSADDIIIKTRNDFVNDL